MVSVRGNLATVPGDYIANSRNLVPGCDWMHLCGLILLMPVLVSGEIVTYYLWSEAQQWK